ncbi:MAG: hypothetical protein J6J79_05890 [Lachnospiraceae bacterium]|nr:hypothetical protein [Lachnospiraceae bacterium]
MKISLAHKGNFGYLKQKRNQVLIMTLIMFAISAALFIAGIVTTGGKENLLTIVAVLGCLPACKSTVSLIMYCKASGCSEDVKKLLESEGECHISMYDLYFTSYKKNFPVSHMVVEGKNICGYSEKKIETNLCEEHLRTILKQSGYKDITIKIFTDINKYKDRLGQLAKIDREPTPEKDAEIRTVLYDISL